MKRRTKLILGLIGLLLLVVLCIPLFIIARFAYANWEDYEDLVRLSQPGWGDSCSFNTVSSTEFANYLSAARDRYSRRLDHVSLAEPRRVQDIVEDITKRALEIGRTRDEQVALIHAGLRALGTKFKSASGVFDEFGYLYALPVRSYTLTHRSAEWLGIRLEFVATSTGGPFTKWTASVARNESFLIDWPRGRLSAGIYRLAVCPPVLSSGSR